MVLHYLTDEDLEDFNVLVINLIKVKKADKAEILSKRKLSLVLQEVEDFEGDLYDKAAVLLSGLVKAHAFASGNRRTAFVATKEFVTLNKGKFKILDDPSYAKVMQGVRENYYSHSELKDWIKNGKIKKFERQD